jgi:protocatechuate 3,4-dioxygenase beta subunit
MTAEGRGQGSFGANQSDPTGKFEIEVGNGTYYLMATASGFAPGKSAQFTVKEGDRIEEIVIDLDAGATVQGVVVAAATGQPLAGANVSLVASPGDLSTGWGWGGPPTKTTDAEGAFVLEGLPEGSVTIAATHPQYAQATVSGILVAKGRPATARIEMTAGGGIRGLVMRGGRPLSNSRVNAWKTDGAGQYVGKDAAVDAQGRFEIRGLPAGEYRLSVMVSSGRRGMTSRNSRSVTVAEGQTTEIDLSEGAGVRVSGRVLSGGDPVVGGMIMAMQPQKGWGGANAEIEAGGTYAIELPGPGDYFFLVQWGGREAGTKIRVTVPEGATSFEYNVELPGGRITGVVVDAETGAVVSNAQVGAFDSGTASRSFTGLLQAMLSMAQTDGQGTFVLSSLPAGTFTLRAFAEGYADARLAGVRLDEGAGLTDLRLALERGVAYRLRVVDPKGQPVAQAMALVRDGNGELVAFTRPAFSNPQGVLEIQGIRPGAYRITVQHRSYAPSSIQAKVTQEAEGPAVTLRPGGKLQLEVVNQKARPVEGAEVEILNERGENVAEEKMGFGLDGMQSSLTNASGSMTLDQVAPGTYRAVARHGAARSREENLSVTEGQTAEMRLTISE